MDFMKKKIHMIFDLDDTLYDLAEPFYLAHREVFPEHSEIDCKALFEKFRIHADIILHKEKAGLIPPEDCMPLRIKRTYEEVGLKLDQETIAYFERTYRDRQKNIVLPEKIEKLLNECKSLDIPMFIFSNGKSAAQRNKIKALGLDAWFADDQIFISEEVGYLKPRLEAFLGVQKAMKAEPGQIWYVGDTYDADVTGSKNAGWNVIWFNHRKRRVEENLADVTVETPEELLMAIKNLVG